MVRMRAVALLRVGGHLPAETAAALHLCERTLRSWDAGWKKDRLAITSRGRPPGISTPQDIAKMLALLWVLGPNTGWETLRPFLPGVTRRELRRLLHRTRQRWRRLSRLGALSLRWLEPGTVWATDFTDAPTPIEGTYPYILTVRDLSSGMTLLALPCEHEDEATASAALKTLFLQFGAPLILKMDNGSAFIADDFRALLEAHRVIPLYSPPRLPSYNGACEAGGGAIKTRAHHLAARVGRPGEWTLDDVEGARLLCNRLGRPQGEGTQSPEDRWNTRRPIEDKQRALLSEAVDKHLAAERSLRGFLLEREPSLEELASMRRAAIARALLDRGLLQFRTRRVSPPISSFLAAVFS
jgi:transposase InsO family protein